MRRPLALALAIAFGLASPAAALIPTTEPAPAEETPEVQTVIDTESDSDSDEAIARRIRGILGELPALQGVDVTVSQGVVTLSGMVPDREDIARAGAIAGRVQGVVTVENGLERDLSVEEGLGSLNSLSDRFGDLWRSLPLLAVALLVAFAIGAFGYLLAGWRGFWDRLAHNAFLSELISSAIRFIFVIGGIVVALDMVGASALLGAVLGGAGVLGIALGFAMRDTVENYVASLMLSLRQPFRANDWVVIENFEGRVIRLTSRATILMTLDGNHLRIPNSTVFKAVILNFTRNPQRRFDFELGIDANDDPTAARQLGVEVMRRLDFVLDDPEPQARLVNVGDSNIVIQFLGWIDQNATDYYKARSQAIPAVKAALEDAGFALPEPIYRLRFDNGVPLTGEGVPAVAPAASIAPVPEPEKPAPAVPEEATDTQPELVVARMVEEERASEGNAKDLLDSRRPIE